MKILVSGSLAYDKIVNFPGKFGDHILPDKIHNLNISFMVDQLTENFGGTAGNIAFNLALLGERPVVLAAAGTDFDPYRAWLKQFGVDTDLVKIIPGEKTAFCFITTDAADNQITAFYPGAMKRAANLPAGEFLKDALAIVAPGNMADMNSCAAVYRKNNVPYIYDPGQQITSLGADDLRAGIAGAKVFISNDYELSMVAQKTGLSEIDIIDQVEALVTTLGGEGSLVKTKGKVYKIPPAKPDNCSDPTGAGDAFRAGFIKGLVAGWPFDAAARLGATAAVYTVEKYGTQTHAFTHAQIKDRYRKNFHEEISI